MDRDAVAKRDMGERVWERWLLAQLSQAHRSMGKPARVLVIEEDPFVAETLCRILRSAAFVAVHEPDPFLAEMAVARERPAFLLCDIDFELRDGVEVLEALRLRFPQVTRFILTGAHRRLTDEEFGRISPCLILNKPFDLSALGSLLERLA